MHTTIIAEAGVNHNGSMTLAKQMVEKAKQAGADYVKFQTFVPEKLVSRFAQKAEYQKKTTGAAESQLQMLQKLALTQEDFIKLQAYCKTVGIGFLSTPFDLESIAFLEKLDMDFWKLPSGEITNLPYLEAIGRTGRDIVMSTGEMQKEMLTVRLWLRRKISICLYGRIRTEVLKFRPELLFIPVLLPIFLLKMQMRGELRHGK